MINVTIWNEYIHERECPEVTKVYPQGIHKCIGEFLSKNENISVKYATLDMDQHGLTKEVLDDTDVLIWWGHAAHEKVSDEIVERVASYIRMGMGLIALHSAHYSKILRKLLGTTMTLKWKECDAEKLYTVAPFHPIAKGIPECFELPVEELYCEYFDIPKPDDIIFEGWYKSGGVFRSGVTFTRGNGKVFYFQPGHEEFPTYYNEIIQKIIVNAVNYVAPVNKLLIDRDNVHID